MYHHVLGCPWWMMIKAIITTERNAAMVMTCPCLHMAQIIVLVHLWREEDGV